jgi:hypothetical protein
VCGLRAPVLNRTTGKTVFQHVCIGPILEKAVLMVFYHVRLVAWAKREAKRKAAARPSPARTAGPRRNTIGSRLCPLADPPRLCHTRTVPL